MRKIVCISILVLLQVAFIVPESIAQAPPPSGGSTVGAPIDSNTWLLALVAFLFGVSKIVKEGKRAPGTVLNRK